MEGGRYRRLDLFRVMRIVGGVVLFTLLILLLFPRSRREATRKLQPTCAQRLKQIGAAIRRYAVEYDHYPPQATTSAEGVPLLSWRVLILPFLGEQELYRRFRLDEPWNSPHNFPLLQEMPMEFRCPLGRNSPPHHTSYLGIAGPHAMFSGAEDGIENQRLFDPLATTMLVAEFLDVTVPWTKPDDRLIEEIGPVGKPGGIGSPHATGGFVLFCDGKVKLLTPDVSEADWRATLTNDGGEPNSWPIGLNVVD